MAINVSMYVEQVAYTQHFFKSVYIIYYFQYIYFKECDVVYVLLPFCYQGCQYVQLLNDAGLFNLQLLQFVFIHLGL